MKKKVDELKKNEIQVIKMYEYCDRLDLLPMFNKVKNCGCRVYDKDYLNEIYQLSYNFDTLLGILCEEISIKK